MRILITRLSHIGDCILTLPLVSAIKRKYPAAVVVWAVESPTQQLLGLHPGIDEIVVVPKGWLKSPASWRSLSKKLKSFKIDTVIDPQGLTKSAMLGRISGAKKRIGIRGQWGRELSPWLNNCLVETVHPHIVDRSLALLSELGIENLGLRRATEKKPPNFREVEAPAETTGGDVFRQEPQPPGMPCSTARLNEVRFELPVCPEAKRSVDAFLNQKGFVPASAPLSQPTHPFAVINPGASWASKRWETDRFATVASGLFQQHGIRSVVTWAGNDEREMAESMHAVDPAAMVIAEKTSLRELAALCQQASFFIGCDTGPLHIAAAMGTPCIGLYGTTRPEDSGAYGSQHIAIQKWYQSGNCRQRRGAANDAMRDILASDVLAACEQMIHSRRDVA